MASLIKVYRNLHRKCWSIKEGNKPVMHADLLTVVNPSFVVQPGGQARVRREKKKYVHAFIKGELNRRVMPSIGNTAVTGRRITYNPYKHDTFVWASNGQPVKNCSQVFLDHNGQAWGF